MSHAKMELFADLLERARLNTLATAAAVPEQNRLVQLREGKATPLWLVGHLANTVNAVVLRWLLGQESLFTLAESRCFAPDFAGGKAPSCNPEDYMTWEEVLKRYEEVMERAVKGVRGLEDTVLSEPLGERFPAFFRERFPTVNDVLMQMVNHDAYHRGQVGLLSKLG